MGTDKERAALRLELFNVADVFAFCSLFAMRILRDLPFPAGRHVSN